MKSKASALGQSRKKPPPSSAGASATRQSTTILPCGVSSAPNRACAGVTLVTSVVSSPLRKVRASAPATLTTPRSGRSAAFMHFLELRQRRMLMLAAQGLTRPACWDFYPRRKVSRAGARRDGIHDLEAVFPNARLLFAAPAYNL